MRAGKVTRHVSPAPATKRSFPRKMVRSQALSYGARKRSARLHYARCIRPARLFHHALGLLLSAPLPEVVENGGRAAVRDSRRNSSSFRKWGFRNASMLGQFYGVAGGGCGVQSRQPSPRSTASPLSLRSQTLSLGTRKKDVLTTYTNPVTNAARLFAHENLYCTSFIAAYINIGTGIV